MLGGFFFPYQTADVAAEKVSPTDKHDLNRASH
jgi:hypothetical protein